ncbi:hypothetical protein [Roseiflexus castenholzii]|uniref:hypothetical protein n=1 Tax=Roseiflexus castenholzii TaxID=120962 RepID=UPI003C7D94D2
MIRGHPFGSVGMRVLSLSRWDTDCHGWDGLTRMGADDPWSYDYQRCVRYLTNVFLVRTADRPDAVVLSDVRIAWDVPDLRPHGPDIMVIFGVQTVRNWSAFDVAQEGVRPILIVEVTLPETRRFDLYEKVDTMTWQECRTT